MLALASEEEEEGDEDPKPRYWDLFAKVDYDLTESQSIRFETLASEDTLDFSEVDGDEFFNADTSYGNQYLWLRHLALLGANTFMDSVASIGSVDQNRTALFTAEFGVRWDHQTHTDEDEFSPRVNLVVDLESGGVVRAGWGHFYQSRQPYELQVQFGETEFQEAQRAEHWILGYEIDLAIGYRLRVDAFRRSIEQPHMRYETLFDPFNSFPEARIDLIRIAPNSAVSNGVEFLLRAPRGHKLNGWLSYAWSQVEDRVGDVDAKRYIDQTHSLTGVINWQPSRKWSLTWVVNYHTGWPVTPLSAQLQQDLNGERFIDYMVGAFYSERLDDYYRMDFRASRTSNLGSGRLTLFLDVRNLFNRDNPRGLAINEPEYRPQPDGTVEVVFPIEDWLSILPSFGASFEF